IYVCSDVSPCPVIVHLSWPTQEDSRLWVSWMPALKSSSASLSKLKHPLVTVARWRRRAKRHNDNDDKKRKGKPMARSLISLPPNLPTYSKPPQSEEQGEGGGACSAMPNHKFISQLMHTTSSIPS
ncbi:unnamed protein product, partial [Musa banksii]